MLKYAVFGAISAVLVPLAVWISYASARGRGWVLAALVFSTSIYVQTAIHFLQIESYQGTDHGIVLCLTDLLAFSLALALMARGSRQFAWMPYNSLWLLALFGACCASAVTAAEPEVSLYTLVTLARAYLVYWCVVNCIRAGTPATYAWHGFTAMVLLVTAKCAYQMGAQGMYRVSGFFVHSNTLPSFLLLLLPSLLLLGLCDRRLGTLALSAIAAATLSAIIVIVKTQSRAGMAVMAGSLIVTVGLALARAPSRRVRLAAVGLCAVVTLGGLWMARGVLHRFNTAPPASAASRNEYNAAALRMADDHLLGVGINCYSWVLSRSDVNAKRYKQGWVIMADAPTIGVAHNIYLLTVAEIGWPGLALFLVVVSRFLWLALREGARSCTLEALLQQGLAIGMGCCLAIGTLEWVMRQTPVMNMYAIAVGLAAGLTAPPRSSRPARRRAQARRVDNVAQIDNVAPVLDAPSAPSEPINALPVTISAGARREARP